MVVVMMVVPRRRPATVCRAQSTLASVMLSWWRVRTIEDMIFSMSLMRRSFAIGRGLVLAIFVIRPVHNRLKLEIQAFPYVAIDC